MTTMTVQHFIFPGLISYIVLRMKESRQNKMWTKGWWRNNGMREMYVVRAPELKEEKYSTANLGVMSRHELDEAVSDGILLRIFRSPFSSSYPTLFHHLTIDCEKREERKK